LNNSSSSSNDHSSMVVGDDSDLETSLANIIEQKSLRWIFVGGKGGVGKTTTSCSLAVQLSKHREKVLLISTDPAHNLSDAFNQKFGKHATRVGKFPNLYAMEIDPTIETETSDVLDSTTQNLMTEFASSIPGIDEAMSFAELMKQVQSMDFSCIVFDTAPTGHTLRLLSFPSVLEKAFSKFSIIKEKFAPLFAQVSGALGAKTEEKLLTRLESTKETISIINKQFQDPGATTFICVCIPEFLSLFETERLVQELTKYGIDTHNIVVNQVLFPESDCRKCQARVRMQGKYLSQIRDLYDDFHVVCLPLLDEEVRGPDAITAFSENLIHPSRPFPVPQPLPTSSSSTGPAAAAK